MKLAFTFLMLVAAAASVQAVMRCATIDKVYTGLTRTVKNGLFGTTSRRNSEATSENLAATCKRQCRIAALVASLNAIDSVYFNGLWLPMENGNRKIAECYCFANPPHCEVPNSQQQANVGSVGGEVVCLGKEDCIRRDMRYTGIGWGKSDPFKMVWPEKYRMVKKKGTESSRPPLDQLVAICKKQCKAANRVVVGRGTAVDTTAVDTTVTHFSANWEYVQNSNALYSANCHCLYADLQRTNKAPGIESFDGYVCGRMECEGFDDCPKPVLTDNTGFTYATNCDCRPDSVQMCIKTCVFKYPSCKKNLYGVCSNDLAVECGQRCLSSC